MPFLFKVTLYYNCYISCFRFLSTIITFNTISNGPKISESFRNLYPNQTVSFRSNSGLFFNPNQSMAHSKSIRMNPVNPNESGQSELIRIIRIYNPKESGQSLNQSIKPNETEFFGIIRIDSDRTVAFGLKVRIDLIHFDRKFGLIRIDRIQSDWKFGLILINSDSSDSFGFIPITSMGWFCMSLGLIRIEN